MTRCSLLRVSRRRRDSGRLVRSWIIVPIEEYFRRESPVVGDLNPGTPWAIYTTDSCSTLVTCGVSFSEIPAVEVYEETHRREADKAI
ncbi:hypothetical protein EAG_10752 [Camponotus floridanus]|uniref:Uncharacterized protein n=1 Tax=Camponotus floridanus TaxID=104421 RepID=E2AXK7_CAMFO|nr:hypothetical protein EAG_10752 [Camponotus floridanus]